MGLRRRPFTSREMVLILVGGTATALVAFVLLCYFLWWVF